MFESRIARTWRGTAAAGVATFAAAVSHSVADGVPASTVGIVLALLVAVPLCIALAGRRLSWVRLSIGVALSQFVLHGLLLIGIADSSGVAGSSAGAPMTPHAHHGHSLDMIMSTAPAASLPHAHADAGMWFAHALAAVVTVLAIGHGERLLRALIDLAGWRFVARLLDWRPRPISRTFTPPAAAPTVVATQLLWPALRRRGPPLAA